MATSGTPQSSNPFRILDLPGELRNIIYKDVLHATTRIKYDGSNYFQPALLSANKQIRREAGPIYYLDNRFEVACPDFNPTSLLTFCKQSHSFVFRNGSSGGECMIAKGGVRVNCNISQGNFQPRNWDNLVKWLKLYHAEEIMMGITMRNIGSEPPVFAAVMRCFYVVSRMRDTPWERVLLSLLYLKLMAEWQGVVWTPRRQGRLRAFWEKLTEMVRRR